MKALLLALVPCVLLLAAAVVMLGVKVLFVKGSRFPIGHYHDGTGDGINSRRKP